jgi:hypothetical protein
MERFSDVKSLIEQLNGPGGTAEGADILQYPFASYSSQYNIYWTQWMLKQ